MKIDLHIGDCRTILKTLPADSIDCVVTSPPYWGLRDYGVGGQIGLEASLQEWVACMRSVFAEVRRVLKPSGTLWLNIGDAHANDGKWGGETGGMQSYLDDANRKRVGRSKRKSGLKPKDLMGQPWRVAFALQEDGWWLRRDIIWHKPAVMPESVRDRPTGSHEFLFLLTKSERYFYDWRAIAEPSIPDTHARMARAKNKSYAPPGQNPHRGQCGAKRANVGHKPVSGWQNTPGRHDPIDHNKPSQGDTKFPRTTPKGSGTLADPKLYGDVVEWRNARSVWTIGPEPYEGAHFATFPTELPRRCILAGCPLGGVVLDPFGGSGSTAIAAGRFHRRAILIELSPAYAELAEARIRHELGMFHTLEVHT